MLASVKRVFERAIVTRMDQENKTFEEILVTYTKLSEADKAEIRLDFNNNTIAK